MGNDLKKRAGKTLTTQCREYGYIQENTPVKDGRGSYSESWSNTHVNPHAMAILPMTAKQIMEYRSVNVEASHLIKIRGEIEISELNRIIVESGTAPNVKTRIFEILSVEDIQERGIVKWISTKERRA